jgi:hypothetical protein
MSFFERFCCLRLLALKQLRKNQLPGSKVLFPSALPLASAGVGGFTWLQYVTIYAYTIYAYTIYMVTF